MAVYLIVYDIQSDKLRTKFAKFLERYGSRIQYSVFSVINSPRTLANIKIEITNQFERRFSQGDSVMIYQIPDNACVAKFGYPVDDDSDLVIR